MDSGSAIYEYDVDGRRFRRTAAGVTTYYIYGLGGEVLSEFILDNTLPTSQTAAPPLDPFTHYHHQDHLGTPRVITDPTGWQGGAVARHNYYPFGDEIPPITQDGETHKFTGKERDAESGLDYFGARYHSGAQGRFTSPDPYNPVEEAGDEAEFAEYLSDPQNWNRYAYVSNNPLKYIDPDGRKNILYWFANPVNQRMLQRVAQRAYVWATRWFNSSKGQEITQTVAENALGSQAPSFSPLRAAENVGVKGAFESGGWIYGRLANGAEVATTFSKAGDNLTVNVIGVANPDNAKGLKSVQEIFSGAFNAARSEGATSLTVRAVGVVNTTLQNYFTRKGSGWKRVKVKLPDGTESEAYEQTFIVN